MTTPLRLLLASLLGAAVAIPASAAALTVPGVPNFHAVNAMVYRGGQPNAEGFASLAKLGVGTVIDLCDEHDAAAERAAVEAAGMTYINIPMSGNGVAEPSAAKVAQVLALLDHATTPVFVHCHLGHDRTGTVIACYRIEHDHWTPAEAQHEANADGMSWMNVGMKRYISHYTTDTAIAGTSTAPLHATAAAVVPELPN